MKILITALALLAALTFNASSIFAADGADHHVAIHVNENDKAKMNMALNNAANIKKYYDSIGETVKIELVAYGPGLHMFRADTSPVIDRINVMSLENDMLSFSVCGNTINRMNKKAGKKIELLEEATVVPSGVVQLIALQEKGYSYVRP